MAKIAQRENQPESEFESVLVHPQGLRHQVLQNLLPSVIKKGVWSGTFAAGRSCHTGRKHTS